MTKPTLPVNFARTVEQPLADLPVGMAEAAEATMHTTNFWAGDLPLRNLGVYGMDAADLAVFLLCTLRRRGRWGGTNAAIAKALHLDEHHVTLIYKYARRQLTNPRRKE
jgi:hypothetical protein